MIADIGLGHFFVLYFGAVLLTLAISGLLSRPNDASRQGDRIADNTRRLSLATTLGFLGVIGGLAYWQILRASELTSRADNPRIVAAALRERRGRLLDREGRDLVTNRIGPDEIVQRLYAHPPLVHVTGFTNPRLGQSGMERAANPELVGRTVGSDLQRVVDGVLHRPRQGDDVALTIDLDIQRAAEQALGNSTGGVVVLDPRTGEILALVSRPWFDPNALTYDLSRGTFEAEARRAQAEWDRLRGAAEAPLLNRILAGQYTPGSTFKTVTLAAALELGLVTPNDRFQFALKPADRDHRVAWHDNQFVSCQNHPQLPELTLGQAYAWSCNVVFAELALEMGPDRFTTMARRFGLDGTIPLELPVSPSLLHTEPNFFRGVEGVYGLAATGIGQGKLAVTPLQMAMVASAVGFNGVLQRPRLTHEVRDPQGPVVKRYEPASWQVAMSARTAEIVKAMMVQGVTEGWGTRARIPGVEVAGKTGTAELGVNDNPHSWFIGLAPADKPRYAIAVVRENAGFGSEQAAPVAQMVLRTALAKNKG